MLRVATISVCLMVCLSCLPTMAWCADKRVGPGEAYSTIQSAVDAAEPGDTIVVVAGTYVENDASQHCLNVDKPLNLVSEGCVIVKASDLASRCVYIDAGAGAVVSFNGFSFDGRRSDGSVRRTAWCALVSSARKTLFRDCSFTGADTLLSYAIHVTGEHTVEDCVFTDDGQSIVQCTAVQEATVTYSGCTFTTTGASTKRVLACRPSGRTDSRVTIRDCTITAALDGHCIQNEGSARLIVDGVTAVLSNHCQSFVAAYNDGTQGDITVRNCHVTYDAPSIQSPVYVYHGRHTVLVEGNVFDCNQDTQWYAIVNLADQPSPVVSGNTINILGAVPDLECAAIVIVSLGSDVGPAVVSRNTIHTKRRRGYAIRIGRETADPTVDNRVAGVVMDENTVYGYHYHNPESMSEGTMHGIFCGYNSAGSIRYNRVYGVPYGIVIKGAGGNWSGSGGVAYNLVVNCRVVGILVKGIAALSVCNNTIYLDNTHREALPKGIQIKMNDNAGENTPSEHIGLQNNLISSAVKCDQVNVDRYSLIGFTSVHNCFWPPDAGFRATCADMTCTSLDAWQALGYDRGSIHANPQFRDPSVFDFRLQPISPCIGTGVATSQAVDILGLGVPQLSVPSIGAYEAPHIDPSVTALLAGQWSFHQIDTSVHSSATSVAHGSISLDRDGTGVLHRVGLDGKSDTKALSWGVDPYGTVLADGVPWGILSTDGQSIISSNSCTTGANLMIASRLDADTTYTIADCKGSWRMNSFSAVPLGATWKAVDGTIAEDGVFAGTETDYEGKPKPFSTSVSIQTDGLMEISDTEAEFQHARMNPDRASFTGVKGYGDLPPTLEIGLRTGDSLITDALQGEWRLLGVSAQGNTLRSSLIMDAYGRYSGQLWRNSLGSRAVAGTAHVDADGTLSAFDNGGDGMRGQGTLDIAGEFLVFTMTDDRSSWLIVGDKKPTVVPALIGFGVVGDRFCKQFSTSTGVLTAEWSIVSGSLPPGLVLSDNGLLSGTPSETGMYTFTVRTESLCGLPVRMERTYHLHVMDAPYSLQISEAKALPDGFPVQLNKAIVTRRVADGYYVESTNRSSGILLADERGPLAEGAAVAISGIAGTRNCERCIFGTCEVLDDTPTPLRPLFMTTLALGGDHLQRQRPEESFGQVGIAGASSLNNIGLLVTVVGRVTQNDPDGRYLYIDDGCGLSDGTFTLGRKNVGVRVVCDSSGFGAGEVLQVTGISSCFRTDEGQTARRILASGPCDLRRAIGSENGMASLGQITAYGTNIIHVAPRWMLSLPSNYPHPGTLGAQSPAYRGAEILLAAIGAATGPGKKTDMGLVEPDNIGLFVTETDF